MKTSIIVSKGLVATNHNETALKLKPQTTRAGLFTQHNETALKASR